MRARPPRTTRHARQRARARARSCHSPVLVPVDVAEPVAVDVAVTLAVDVPDDVDVCVALVVPVAVADPVDVPVAVADPVAVAEDVGRPASTVGAGDDDAADEAEGAPVAGALADGSAVALVDGLAVAVVGVFVAVAVAGELEGEAVPEGELGAALALAPGARPVPFVPFAPPPARHVARGTPVKGTPTSAGAGQPPENESGEKETPRKLEPGGACARRTGLAPASASPKDMSHSPVVLPLAVVGPPLAPGIAGAMTIVQPPNPGAGPRVRLRRLHGDASMENTF